VEGVQVEFEAKSARDGAWYGHIHISYLFFFCYHVFVCVLGFPRRCFFIAD
jgi:hypothetical protein